MLIDECRREVRARRVDARRGGRPLLEVAFVHVFGRLRLEHVEVARELKVVLGQVRAWEITYIYIINYMNAP